MNISVDQVLASLTDETVLAPKSGWPSGAPTRDFERSPIAARTGRLAASEGFFCFHFEHRAHLELPESWVVDGHEQEAAPQTWEQGVLAERKYQSFRHDLMVGSFHPGHRGKWTTHELCHNLVGYAWRPDATPFFHATAARLAELLPVALYYFFDEAGLTRCEDHEHGGALYRSFCNSCEQLASARPIDTDLDRRHIEEGLRFVERELATIARSRREGRPLPHRHGSLELSSDSVSYAHSHGQRLHSAAFHDWVSLFGSAAGGLSETLDELEARTIDVLQALTLGEPCPIRSEGDPRHWARQDIAMRMLQVREDTEGAATQSLSDLVGDVAAGGSLANIRERYTELADEYVLPPAQTLWAVGYPIADHHGQDLAQVEEGLRSAAPLCLQLLTDAGLEPVIAFAEHDPPLRQSIGERFRNWLRQDQGGFPSELAAFEFAIQTARGAGMASCLGAHGEGLTLASGFTVLACDHDVVSLAERIGEGDQLGMVIDGQLQLDGTARHSCGFAIGQDSTGELLIIGLDHDSAQALAAHELDAIPEAERTSLLELGALVRTRWTLTKKPMGE